MKCNLRITSFIPKSISKFLTTCIPLVLLLFGFGCKKNEEKLFQKEAHYSIDSAITFAQTLNQEKRIRYLYQYTNKKIFAASDQQNVPQLLAYIDKWKQQSNQADVLNMWLRLMSTYHLQKGNIDSALLYSQNALHHAQNQSQKNIVESYRILSLSYYYKAQTDSAVYYWKLGYKEAVITKDAYNTYTFANNLGTHYYNEDNLNLAFKFFTLALKASSQINLKEPILTNNIISTLISQQKHEKALEYWEKNRDILVMDTNTYKGQLIYFSRINLLQLLNRNQEADSLLARIPFEKVNSTLIIEYLRVLLNSKFNKRDLHIFRDPILQKPIEENLVKLILQVKNEWINNLEKPEIQQLIPLIESNFSQLNNSNSKDYKALYQLSKILAYHYANYDPSKSIAYFKSSSQFKKIIDKNQEIEQNKNTNELSELEVTLNDIKEKEAIIEKEAHLRNILIASVFILLLIIILITRIYQKNLRIKTIQQEHLKAQQEYLKTQQESLKKEQELNNRIVEYSKSIITINRQIKQQLSLLLSQVSVPVQKQIKEIQSNLQDIVTLDSEENPALAEKIITEKEDWEQKYPGFGTLNKTEKRIFVLTLENYKTKEIAHVLGVAVQYVRNVKSRLRKKLNLPEDW